MAKALVLGMKTWGQLGNKIAAMRLGESIAKFNNISSVEVVFADDLIPILKKTGTKIRVLSKAAVSEKEKYRSYMEIQDCLLEYFPKGFEVSSVSDFTAEGIRLLKEYISAYQPDVILGTKGLISRICFFLVRELGLECRVLNYITNPGLLELEIHQSQWLEHIISFEFTRSKLISLGCPEKNIHTIGSAISDVNAYISDLKREEHIDERQLSNGGVLILSNYGGETYLDYLKTCMQANQSSNVLALFCGQPEVFNDAKNMMQFNNKTNCFIFEELQQSSYLSYASIMAKSNASFLLTKSGPNTVMEAVSLGLPLLVHWSGLPMERWIIQVINKYGLGVAVEASDQIPEILDDWLENPKLFSPFIANLEKFSQQYFRDLPSERLLKLQTLMN